MGTHPRGAIGSTSGLQAEAELNPAVLLAALQSMRTGDFSVRLPGDWAGLAGKIADTFNDVVIASDHLAGELKRVSESVGRQGRTRERVRCERRVGSWGAMETSVNGLVEDLLWPTMAVTRSIAAVAQGDLSETVPLEVDGHRIGGEFLRSAQIVNKMIEQMRVFTFEVTRVAREVGSEGTLGGQADVRDVSGVWKDLTDNVNSMANHLTAQVRNISEVTIAVANGDLSRKITVDVRGEMLQLKDAINTMVDQLRLFASEVTRVAREVGTEGKLGGQATVPGVAGTWKDLTDNVNVMATNLTDQVRGIAEVATAIARGDLSRKITVDVKGELLELKDTINTLVDQLNGFAAEVTRVARDVGTEGKLGGQATVPGVAGTWKDLTDNVNVMAENLTNQVRGIVKVVTAVAHGDLTQKLTVESKGEVAALAKTINSMTDTLAIFADQVTTVAREVGVEGRLGGQANVPGAAGTWKDLTANVNLLAANLTTQVRAIADVATAVTKGDLTRFIQVDASGEVADLKNYINAMIGNLRQTTDRNTEQDWLKTNLANFSRKMQGQRDLHSVADMLLSELAPLVAAQQGIMYVATEAHDGPLLRQVAAYADSAGSGSPREYAFGEGLIGQCASERKALVVADMPANSIRISSGMVDAVPRSVVVLPVLFEDKVRAVIELASIDDFAQSHISFLEQLADIIGVVINNIEGTMRTERLLAQSQQLATEQQTQQRELQKTNEELAQKAQLLAARNAEVERKNQEIEQARRALEEKAAELALTSRYKSEFLANMSHELRTPLNSILVLGQQLADNAQNNLSARQVEYASTIRAAGTDLLNLISDILDLSKIESGTVAVESEEVELESLKTTVERTFRHESESGSLSFTTEFESSLGSTINTDPKRLLQVLKNLLSNSFKFTERGSVKLRVSTASKGWSPGHPVLDKAASVVAFAVSDTGIGIPHDKQKIVFEAFQQADAGTARKHGGTGLGLAISRELAQLLGGEITLQSTPGSGSTFTLYLPTSYAGPVIPAIPAGSPVSARTSYAPVLTPAPRQVAIADDRQNLEPGDRILLLVHKDPGIAAMVIKAAHGAGMRAVVAARGADAVALARKYRPEAVSLDTSLADMHGWSVLSRFKHDPDLRHIPVQVIADEAEDRAARRRGAFSTLRKPVRPSDLRHDIERILMLGDAPKRHLLVAGTAQSAECSIVEGTAGGDIATTVATDTGDAMRLLLEHDFDCVAIDALARDVAAIDLLQQAHAVPALRNLPFVVHADRAWAANNGPAIDSLADEMVIRITPTIEGVLDECCLFLHRRVATLAMNKRQMLRRAAEHDVLVGKTVLVVDDDVRNIFALSTLLERQQMQVVSAQTGRDALRLIGETNDLSLVLLDLMMPELDGLETMHQMRSTWKFERPIIALTAKAMTGDREKCIEAGASDYIAKPVDSENLLSLLRVWLDR
jgi:signal transduction histidine kinase/DNA-binding response OmpR family regulator/HAMP domain-containing protein